MDEAPREYARPAAFIVIGLCFAVVLLALGLLQQRQIARQNSTNLHRLSCAVIVLAHQVQVLGGTPAVPAGKVPACRAT